MRNLYLLMLIVIGGVTVGSVAALEEHNSPPVNVNGGNLNIIDGGMIFTRTDGIQTGLTLKNDVAQKVIIFHDVDSGKQYMLRHTADGSRMDFLNFDGTARVDLAIETSTGNIGMGTITPSEKLDVNGNIHLSGTNSKITSNGDICIGSC